MDNLAPLFSLEAEMAALGSMILSLAAADSLTGKLSESDFYRPAHRRIFTAIGRLLARSAPIDLLTLRNEMGDLLSEAGGDDYLIEIAAYVPSAANANHYAQLVQDLGTRRRLEHAGHQIARLARVEEEEGMDIAVRLERAEQCVYEVGRKRRGSDPRGMASLTREFFEEIDDLIETGQPRRGISSGIPALDAMTTGFYPGELIIVGGRPSMGKSAFGFGLALAAARAGRGAVPIFSLEMTSVQVTQRLVQMSAGVDSYVFKAPGMPPHVYRKLADASEQLYSLPLHVDDQGELSIPELRGKCRRLASSSGIALIVVDYLELMRSGGKPENRTQEIGEIAKGCKALAKEMECPVVLLSQLNREVEKRDEKRPRLSDLRQSGEAEAAADRVLFPFRPAYYDRKGVDPNERDDHDYAEVAELIVAKNRNGKTGTVKVAFQGAYARYRPAIS